MTDEEQAAIRRYVAKWSKNSTILPIKDPETGDFKYVDFSHANAYDTLIRPIQAVINAVADGRTDNDGIMDDFMKGTFTAMKEFASPFISQNQSGPKQLSISLLEKEKLEMGLKFIMNKIQLVIKLKLS